MVWLLAPLAAVAEATQFVGLFFRLDVKQFISSLPVRLESGLFVLLIILDVCTYLLTRSLQAVVGWHAGGGGGTAGELKQQLLRASIRLDLLLVLPVLLYATADLLLALGTTLDAPLFYATIGALGAYTFYLALLLCASRWPRGAAARVAMVLGAAQLLALLAVSILVLQAAEGGAEHLGNDSPNTNRSSLAFSRSSSAHGVAFLLVGVAAALRSLQLGLACLILRHAPRTADTSSSLVRTLVRATADTSALVRALSHEAVQHVVKGEVVSIRREGHPESRGFARFELETLSFRFSAQDAVGLDQMTSVEHVLLECASPFSSSSRDSGMEANQVEQEARQRRCGRSSSDGLTIERHRNALSINYLDTQGGDKCLEVVLGSSAARERWQEGLSLLCGAVPWSTLPRGEALWARRVFNQADVARQGLLDEASLPLLLAAANTAPRAQQYALPHALAALARSGGKLSHHG